MGQYYLVVNLDKGEYLYPHKFGDGLKLLEFGASGCGTMTGLAVLLADGNGRGGGDLHSDNPIIGSWAGDRIVIAGDYADKWTLGAPPDKNVYDWATEEFTDISEQVISALRDDPYLAREMRQPWA